MAEAVNRRAEEEGTTAHGGPATHHVDPAIAGVLNATVIVSIAMIVFLGILIWKKAPAAILGSLDRKIAAIRAQLDEATQLRAEAEALRARYEDRLRQADGEAAELLAAAEREAAAMVAKAKADTDALIVRRRRMAEDKIAAAERTAIADLRARVAAAAAAAAAALIAERHDAGADAALIDQSIGALGNRPH